MQRLTDEQYLTCQMQVFRMAALARTLPLAEFLAMIDRADAVAPMVNPTLYRAAGAKMAQVRTLAAALREFQRAAEGIVATAAPAESEAAHVG